MSQRMRRVGNVTLHLVSDGVCRMDGGGVFGIVPKVMWQGLAGVDEQNRIPMELNCLLIETSDTLILVDTGFGPNLTPKQRDIYDLPESRLVASLAELGYSPSDIDIVINTHLHPDHCGGNVRVESNRLVPTFPNATYIVQHREWHDAVHPNERTRGVYVPESLRPIEAAGQLRLAKGNTVVTPEVRCVVTPGHTRGHQSVVVESDGQTAVYLGDLAPWAVYLERLAWTTAFDMLPLETVDTKKAIRSWALQAGALLVFEHDPSLFWGRMVEQNGRNRVVPA